MLLISIFFVCIFHFSIGASNFNFEKFEQCSDKPNLPNTFEDIVVSHVGLGKTKLYGTIRIRQEIQAPVFCAMKEDQSTCEYYYTFRSDKFCDFVSAKNMPWSNFWEQSKLPPSCPITVGNYTIDGAEFDTGSMLSLPLLNGHWKARSSGTSKGNKIWHCVETAMSILPPVQRRRKSKS